MISSETRKDKPIGSMYGIFTYIWLISMHGSYGKQNIVHFADNTRRGFALGHCCEFKGESSMVTYGSSSLVIG